MIVVLTLQQSLKMNKNYLMRKAFLKESTLILKTIKLLNNAQEILRIPGVPLLSVRRESAKGLLRIARVYIRLEFIIVVVLPFLYILDCLQMKNITSRYDYF